LKQALDNNDEVFNMSGGAQERDYLPVEKAAEYIAKISINDDFSGIVNCCSGRPVSIRSLVENYLRENHKSIKLNLGYYPYPDYEPMAFWGNNNKLRKLIEE
jgi:dTDP-6-deoxy-L-talose 4-dehydrogenase (NAD+)